MLNTLVCWVSLAIVLSNVLCQCGRLKARSPQPVFNLSTIQPAKQSVFNVSTIQPVKFPVFNFGCECWVKNANTKSIRDWMDMAVRANLDACCKNYASVFGWWGESTCPDTLQSVQEAIHGGTTAASGGKSGTKPIFAGNYVIKTIDAEEKVYLDKLLDASPALGLGTSLLAPICRVLKVSGPNVDEIYVIVMTGVSLRGSELHPYHGTFDLKGNWDYSARMAKSTADVLKDGNFHRLFPDGLYVDKLDLDLHVGENVASIFLTEMIKTDTKTLLDVGLMDYSLLVDLVEVCSYRQPDCADQVFVSVNGFSPGPTDKPLALGTFKKSCLRPTRHHDGRPIYVNDKKEYLFFWNAHSEWAIGKNPNEFDRYVFALDGFWTTAARTVFMRKKERVSCPHDGKEVWSVLKSYPPAPGKSWTTAHKVTVRALDESLPMFDQASILAQNPGKPLVWATANGKTYAMVIGIIDLFMHGEHRGFANTLASGLTFSDCTPGDIDPIPAMEYRVRFMRMIGYKDPDMKDGNHCGACLGSRRRVSYTYFPHALQQQQKQISCEWGS